MDVAERICSLLDENESLKREISQKTFRIGELEGELREALNAKQDLDQVLDHYEGECAAAQNERDNAKEALHYKEEQVKQMELEIYRLKETPIWAEEEGIVYDIAYLEPLRTKLEEALKDKYKIQALKILREATKCSLPVAKKVIERMQETRDDIPF